MPKHNYLSLLFLPCSNVTMQGMSWNVVGIAITLYGRKHGVSVIYSYISLLN